MSKHIHFIGICGVGMSALAIMMKNKGHKVTGSDVGFYPPISTHLKEHGIEYYAGWHAERIRTKNETPPSPPLKRGGINGSPPFKEGEGGGLGDKPDLVVVGNVAGSENPEWKYVLENKIPYVSYPELIAKELARSNSIVCAGTYGKTSTSALLSWILINAGLKPAYMFGGLSSTPALASDDLGGDWSVLEGDEYKTSRWDNSPKFSHYSPTHLLLTAVKWDHADIYPSEAAYFEAFEKLVKAVPATGLTVINENVPQEILRFAQDDKRLHIVKYGRDKDCDYQYSDVKSTKTGLNFKIKHQSSIFKLQTSIIGGFQAENICGAFAMAHEIGIEPEKIIKSIASFAGIKRRLEIRGKTKAGATVIDDIAHSPAKAQSVLETLIKIYKTTPHPLLRKEGTEPKIFCVFEPNSGNRKPESADSYHGAFANADEVIISRPTKLKDNAEFLSGQQLTDTIKADNPRTRYFENDQDLVEYLKQKPQAGDVIVFCGSHGFRGMIEELIS